MISGISEWNTARGIANLRDDEQGEWLVEWGRPEGLLRKTLHEQKEVRWEDEDWEDVIRICGGRGWHADELVAMISSMQNEAKGSK